MAQRHWYADRSGSRWGGGNGGEAFQGAGLMVLCSHPLGGRGLHPLSARALIVPNADVLAQTVAPFLAQAFARILRRKERVYFIPSSGRTPLKTYHLLASDYGDALDWSRVSIVQMDEYWTRSLAPSAYFHTFLRDHLVVPLKIGEFISLKKSIKKPSRTGAVELYSPEEYAGILNEIGPIDFALHGIGRNGHIGFNEPGASGGSITRLVALDAETKDDNFPNLANEERPQYGITLGLSDLKRVRHSLLIASGAAKGAAIRNLLERTEISQTPASILWDSPDFGVIIDQQAAGLGSGHNRADARY